MNALVFAAGLGTRLRPLTDNRPKALVEVNGRPLLEHNLLKLKAAGFTRVVVNVHHFGEQIINFLSANGNFGLDIRVSDERALPLDTGGGLRKAIALFDDDAPILIHNVDIVSDADLGALYRQHCESGADATLAINQRTTSTAATRIFGHPCRVACIGRPPERLPCRRCAVPDYGFLSWPMLRTRFPWRGVARRLPLGRLREG